MDNPTLKPEENFQYLAASYLVSVTGRNKGKATIPSFIAGLIPIAPMLLSDSKDSVLLSALFCALFGASFYLLIEVAWLYTENVRLRIRIKNLEPVKLRDLGPLV